MTATVSDSDASWPLRVAVIGGGITGLAAAQRLVSKSDTMQVTLFESSRRLGGIIRTEEADGFLIELGPDSFITNKPAGLRLCQQIGFTEHLIPTDAGYRRSLVLRNGQPMTVPDGFMLMAPAKPWAIMTTPVLSLGGKLRLLAITNPTRVSTFDGTPTVAESVPGYDSRGWFGFIAPAGTPREIVNQLNAEINRAMSLPDVRDKLTSAGLFIVNEPPEYFAAVLKSDYAKYGKLIRDIKFQPQ